MGSAATDCSYAEGVAKARFLLRPRWLLSHLFVVLLVVTMVNLGFWQLRRLDEKRDRNALVEARAEQPVTSVGQLLDPGDDDATVEGVRYRSVTATGAYDDDATVAVRNRTQDGVAGAWLMTPLRLEGGERVGVIRGFVGLASDGSVVDAPAPTGEVTVTGLVVDPDGLDGTAPRDIAPLLAAGDGILPARAGVDPSGTAARAVRGAPPRLRGPVVHLRRHRGHRLSAGAAGGCGEAGQSGRRPRRARSRARRAAPPRTLSPARWSGRGEATLAGGGRRA